MSITRNAINQSGILKMGGLNAAGVCLEACRRWVRAVLESRLKAGDTVYDIISPTSIRELLAAHQKRNKKSEKKIEGLDLQVTSRTGGGFTKFQGLQTRQDVIDCVLTVPGAYIYVVDAAKGGGHAFAFNTIDRKHVLFFDPNLGEWLFDDENEADMRTWWNDFWQGTHAYFAGKESYKDAYHKGGRELWRYSVPDRI